MTFYVVHMRPLAFARMQTRLCSKKRAMTRKGVDLDMKLASTLREVFKYANKYIFSRKNSPGSFKLTLQTVVHVKINPFPCHRVLFATESSLCANANGRM